MFDEAFRWLHRSARTRAAIVLAGGLCACGLLYSGTATSAAPMCPSRLLFRAPCPSCGMTRACAAILHTDLPYAWQANIASPVVALGLLALAVGYAYQLATGKTPVADFWGDAGRRARVGWCVLALMLAAWGVGLYRHFHGAGPLNLPSWHATHGRAPTIDLPGGRLDRALVRSA